MEKNNNLNGQLNKFARERTPSFFWLPETNCWRRKYHKHTVSIARKQQFVLPLKNPSKNGMFSYIFVVGPLPYKNYFKSKN